MDDEDDCSHCSGSPWDCPVCCRMNEPYSYDEVTGEAIYKDLFTPIKEDINDKINKSE